MRVIGRYRCTSNTERDDESCWSSPCVEVVVVVVVEVVLVVEVVGGIVTVQPARRHISSSWARCKIFR